MGDIQISGAAMTVIVAMVGSMTGAIVYMFKALQASQDRRLQELRGDFQQALKDLRSDYQERLNDCQQQNADLKLYLNRQAGTVKESTELLRDLSAGHVGGKP